MSRSMTFELGLVLREFPVQLRLCIRARLNQLFFMHVPGNRKIAVSGGKKTTGELVLIGTVDLWRLTFSLG